MFTLYAFGGICKFQKDSARLMTDMSMKCGGVRLILKAFGALLKYKKDIKNWKDVMEKMNWDIIMDEKKVFKCLRISYDDLPQNQ